MTENQLSHELADINARFCEMFTQSKKILDTATGCVSHNNVEICSINDSSIASILIHAAGRWCERYASDVIISWDNVRESLKKHTSEPNIIDDDIIVFGFRKDGVDGNTFVNSQMQQKTYGGINDYYSKIYAVRISDTIDEYSKNITMELRDIAEDVGTTCYKWRNL